MPKTPLFPGSLLFLHAHIHTSIQKCKHTHIVPVVCPFFCSHFPVSRLFQGDPFHFLGCSNSTKHASCSLKCVWRAGNYYPKDDTIRMLSFLTSATLHDSHVITITKLRVFMCTLTKFYPGPGDFFNFLGNHLGKFFSHW